MGLRSDLQSLFELLADNVYFQPPSNLVMSYPCVVYQRDSAITDFADDNVYYRKLRYQVMVIDRNPDSDIFDRVAALPSCTFDRHYVVDNLNHDVFTLYF